MKGDNWQNPATRVVPYAIRAGTDGYWKGSLGYGPRVLTYSWRSDEHFQGPTGWESGSRKELASSQKDGIRYGKPKGVQ